ncbi:MAG: twin-arginine translocase subunit TatC [Anaerolineaceae bacterium]
MTEHLEELRAVLLKALAGLGVGVAISLFFTKRVIDFLAKPVGGIQNLQAIEVTETISVYMRVALLCGVIIALPWIFYQLLQFIGQGLKPQEKKNLYITIPFAVILFVGGAVFAYYVMLPSSMKFFTEFMDVETALRIKSYFSFLTNMIFWIGCSFELPLIVFLLARLGIVNAKMLTKGWRIAVVVITVLAAVITPTADPVNMAIFMVPLFGLYLLSIGLAAIAQKKKKIEEAKEEN